MKYEKKTVRKIANYACIGGILLCFCAYAVADFDIKNLSNSTPYEERQQTQSSEGIKEIEVDTSFDDIQVLPSDDEDIHISYYENNHYTYAIQKNGSTLSIRKKSNREFYEFFMNIELGDKGPLVIQIPTDFGHDLRIDTGNGDVEVSDIETMGAISLDTSFGDVHVKNLKQTTQLDINSSNGEIFLKEAGVEKDLHLTTTFGKLDVQDVDGKASLYIDSSNGNVNMRNVLLKGDMDVRTTFGEVEVAQSSAGNATLNSSNGSVEILDAFTCTSFKIDTTFGNVRFKDLHAEQIELTTSNGDIDGNVIGSQSEYTIETDVSNGDTTLYPSTGTTEKNLRAETTFGDLSVSFSDR